MQVGFRGKRNDAHCRAKDGAERKGAGKVSRKRLTADKNRKRAWRLAGYEV